MSDPRKQTVFFTAEEHAELDRQAKRLDRSKAWIIQRAWKIARARIRALPTASEDGE